MNEQEIYIAALSRDDPSDLQRFLDEACGDAPHLRERLEQLFRHGQQAERFMEDSPLEALSSSEINPQDTLVGTVIGPYKLCERVGEGGMGEVYVAEQQAPMHRTVALKLIKPGMDSKEVVARFEAERQTLALMDHPHIARVFDGGMTDSGRPYFVMELVGGAPITEFGDQQELSVQQRLGLFTDVCRATQHAHQKGIIHRDVKPTNVLVSLHDDKPIVKVIDFGVAKAIEAERAGPSVATRLGQVVGTPTYMSPEQAGLRTYDIDTRSDIYSLGVLLYELLTGATPIDKNDLVSVSQDEARRMICQRDPLRPSDQVSTLEAGLATTVAEQRGTVPFRLFQQLRGDLDWIVMKCLEKDRTRRYETASALSADIERFIRGDLVEARPPALGYRVHKFVRRNAHLITATTLILFCLVGGIAGTTMGLLKARRERDAAHIARNEKETQRQIAERNAQRADAYYRVARQTIDGLIKRVGDELALSPQLSAPNNALLEEALKYYQSFIEEDVVETRFQRDAAAAALRIGSLQSWLAQPKESLAAYQNAEQLYAKLHRQDPEEPGYLEGQIQANIGIGEIHQLLGQYDDAQTAVNRALRLIEQQRLAKPATANDPLRPIALKVVLGRCMGATNCVPEANELCLTALNELAKIKSELTDQAEYFAVRSRIRSQLAEISYGLRDLREAKDHMRQAVADQRSALRHDRNSSGYVWGLSNLLNNLAIFERQSGNLAKESVARRERLDLARRLAMKYPSAPHCRAALADGLKDWAGIQQQRGDHTQALATFREALRVSQELLGDYPDHPEHQRLVARSSVQLAELLIKLGHHDQAVPILRAVRQLWLNLVEAFPTNATHRQNLKDLDQMLTFVEAQRQAPAVAQDANQDADDNTGIPEQHQERR